MPQIFWDTQTTTALIFGMLLQLLMGGKIGVRLVLTVIIATLFVGWYLTPAAIELANIDPQSKIATAMIAMSTLISVEIIAFLIAVLPKAISNRVKSFLGVKDATI